VFTGHLVIYRPGRLFRPTPYNIIYVCVIINLADDRSSVSSYEYNEGLYTILNSDLHTNAVTPTCDECIYTHISETHRPFTIIFFLNTFTRYRLSGALLY